MTTGEYKSQADVDWENRTLCSDESCIGIIGPDGLCKECGKPFEGEFKPVTPAEGPEENFDESAEVFEDIPDDHSDENPDDHPDDHTDDDWGNRTLCVDESCIGVIGPDGRCKECGKTLDDELA